MAWSWSHTAEAYEDVRQNCSELPRETLLEIAAEWLAYRPEASELENFSLADYSAALLVVAELDTEALASQIWHKAAEQQTCTNGGWLAWLCPFGCEPHSVPFHREEQ